MGMTGRISTPDYIPSLESLSKTESFPPPHTHLILKAQHSKEDDAEIPTVAYSDPRRFGAVHLTRDIHKNNKDHDDDDNDNHRATNKNNGPLSAQWDDFAPDALDLNSDNDGIQKAAEACMRKLILRRRGIKALLLDQRAIVSGVGNWIVDEVLYQSHIHPDQNFLTSGEVDVVQEKLGNILSAGIDCLSRKQRFPDDWIFHRRWSAKSSEAPKDANGENVSFLKAAGRTSAVVKSIQKKKKRTKAVDDGDGNGSDCDLAGEKVKVEAETKKRKMETFVVKDKKTKSLKKTEPKVKEDKDTDANTKIRRRSKRLAK